jgi:uncharacterized protein YbjT (DUF2867 family)
LRVVVAGGTGLLGHHVVRYLTEAGHDPVIVARSNGVDLTTGEGLDAAMAGADAVIDATNITTFSRKASVKFFTTATRNLLAAAERAEVHHLVCVSIVGIDEVDLGYYEGKRQQERILLASAVPTTILRATQFHEFADQILRRSGPSPVALVPRIQSQPIAVREVADALVALALRSAVGRAPDLAGPREEQVVSMVRRLLRARGSRRVVAPLRLPGATGKALASGGLLPRGSGPCGVQTFEQWLDSEDARTRL